MEVIVKKNYEEMSKAAATLFAAEIMENPKTILGMATGSTPVGLYKELVKMYEAGDLDFSQVTTFNLDEYIGLRTGNNVPCRRILPGFPLLFQVRCGLRHIQQPLH